MAASSLSHSLNETASRYDSTPKSKPALQHQWLYEDYKVSLWERGGTYVVVRHDYDGSPDTKTLISKDKVARAISGFPEYSSDKLTLRFCDDKHIRWNEVSEEVSLITKEGSLRFQLIDKLTHTTSDIPADVDCHFPAILTIDEIARIFLKYRDSILQNYREYCQASGSHYDPPALNAQVRHYLESNELLDNLPKIPDLKWILQYLPLKVKVNYLANFHASVRVTADKLRSVFFTRSVVVESQVNKDVLLDWDNWGITLLSTSSDCSGHARIAIEGLRKGRRFFRFADFVPDTGLCNLSGLFMQRGKIQYGKYVEDDLHPSNSYDPTRTRAKTKAWLCHRISVLGMMQNIKFRKRENEAGRKVQYFNQFGGNTLSNFPNQIASDLFTGESVHNCLSWAFEVLPQAGLFFPDSNPFVEMPSIEITEKLEPDIHHSFQDLEKHRCNVQYHLVMKMKSEGQRQDEEIQQQDEEIQQREERLQSLAEIYREQQKVVQKLVEEGQQLRVKTDLEIRKSQQLRVRINLQIKEDANKLRDVILEFEEIIREIEHWIQLHKKDSSYASDIAEEQLQLECLKSILDRNKSILKTYEQILNTSNLA